MLKSRRFRLARAATLVGISLALLGARGAARADVVVLANRTETPLSAIVTPSVGAPQRVLVGNGDAVPVFVDGRATVEFASRGQPKKQPVDANCAYFFGRNREGGTELTKIGLGEDATTTSGRN